MTSLAAQTDSSISFLAQILAALQFAQQTLSPTRLFRQDEFQIDDRKVSVRLVMPTGDAYRVTVEWISEDSRMSEVWKYPIVRADQEIVMPEGAELLHVDHQYGNLTLWARVIPTGQSKVLRSIIVRGTGEPIWTQPYVGTVLTAGGELVWHVFDGGEIGAAP